jgi:hypothetical protein
VASSSAAYPSKIRPLLHWLLLGVDLTRRYSRGLNHGLLARIRPPPTLIRVVRHRTTPLDAARLGSSTGRGASSSTLERVLPLSIVVASAPSSRLTWLCQRLSDWTQQHPLANIAAAAQQIGPGPRLHPIRPTCLASTQI